MPFNLGPMELILVMVVLLLLFGAKRLPELGSGLGRGIREFKRSMSEIKEEVNRVEPPSNPNQIHTPVNHAQVAPPTREPAERDSWNKS
jgi:sec-independent protein translocase protein TatA